MLSHPLLNKLVNKTTLFTVAALIITALVVSARAWLKPLTKTTDLRAPTAKTVEPASLSATTTAGVATVQKRLDALIIKLRRTGFEPSALTLPKGRFLLAFDNHTGEDEIIVQLKQETGNKLHEVRMPRGNVRWRQALDLHPGSYRLSVVDRPEWVCRLTITPH
jgi:hypothetical protein